MKKFIRIIVGAMVGFMVGLFINMFHTEYMIIKRSEYIHYKTYYDTSLKLINDARYFETLTNSLTYTE